jgi:pimeloyl-[acyl-carrier protein] synthase
MTEPLPNFFGADFLSDPYPHYRRLRVSNPVAKTSAMRGNDWVVTRFADVRSVLVDRSTFSVEDVPSTVRSMRHLGDADRLSAIAESIRHWLFFTNPPLHTTRRERVARAFTPRAIEDLGSCARRLLHLKLRPSSGSSTIDIVNDLGAWLPAAMMLDLLGITDVDTQMISVLAGRIFQVFERPVSPSRFSTLGTSVIELEREISIWLGDPKRHIRSDRLLDRLRVFSDEDPDDHSSWLHGFVTMLLAVGQDTTRHLLGNALFALSRSPEAWTALCKGGLNIGSALEELARFDTPVQVVVRLALVDTSLAGQRIHAGDRLYLFLGSALRDEAEFERPDEIRFDREPSAALQFGAGPHFCLGAHVARLAATTVLSHLVRGGRRAPIVLVRNPPRLRCVHLRGFTELPVELDLSD